jgi:hypothetical protein
MKYGSIEKLDESFPTKNMAAGKALKSIDGRISVEAINMIWNEIVAKWFKYHKGYYLISKKKYEEIFGIDEVI